MGDEVPIEKSKIIKNSKFTLCKNPENLNVNRREKSKKTQFKT